MANEDRVRREAKEMEHLLLAGFLYSGEIS